MGQAWSSVGYSIKRKVDELRSTFDVIVSYPQWNSKEKKWEESHLKFTFDKSYKYSGKEIKQLISKEMNMDEDKLFITTGASTIHTNALQDNIQYQINKLHVIYNIEFNIKYFASNKLNDIVYDINYTLHTITASNNQYVELYRLIDAEIIKGNVCLGSLILQRPDKNIHLTITGYCRRFIQQIPYDILCIEKYDIYVITKKRIYTMICSIGLGFAN